MARYPKREIERLSEVDEVTLERFQSLSPTRQWKIIDLLHRTAEDPKLAQQDLNISKERESQFRDAAKKRPKRRSG